MSTGGQVACVQVQQQPPVRGGLTVFLDLVSMYSAVHSPQARAPSFSVIQPASFTNSLSRGSPRLKNRVFSAQS